MPLEHLRHGLAELALAEAVDEADLPAVGERGVVEQLVDALAGLLDGEADQLQLGGDLLGEETATPPRTARKSPSRGRDSGRSPRRRRLRLASSEPEGAAAPGPRPGLIAVARATSSACGTRRRLPEIATSASSPWRAISSPVMPIAFTRTRMPDGERLGRGLLLLGQPELGVLQHLVARVADGGDRLASAGAGRRAAAFWAASTFSTAARMASAAFRSASSARRFSSLREDLDLAPLLRHDLPLGEERARPRPLGLGLHPLDAHLLALELGLLPLEPREERLGLLLLVVPARARVGDHLGRQPQPLGHLEGEAAAGRAQGEAVGRLVGLAGGSRRTRSRRRGSTARRPSSGRGAWWRAPSCRSCGSARRSRPRGRRPRWGRCRRPPRRAGRARAARGRASSRRWRRGGRRRSRGSRRSTARRRCPRRCGGRRGAGCRAPPARAGRTGP